MILCVTPNVAIDRTLVVAQLERGGVYRAEHQLAAAGGKGLNVARAIRTLGGEALCAGFIGGYAGRMVEALAAQDSLACSWTHITGETRTCVLIVDAARGEVTEIDEQGPTVSADDWEHLQADVLREAIHAECVCLSGSLPPGSPLERYTQLIQAVRSLGRQIWVDTGGAALHTALAASGVCIKVNHVEAGAALGRSIQEVESALGAAHSLREQGAETVVLTLGKLGALLVGASGSWYAQPPPLQVVSTVASGDVFLAGLVTGGDSSKPDALRRAVAAGAANTLSVGGGRFERSDFDQVLAQTELRSL